MFTGIIRHSGILQNTVQEGTNLHLTIKSDLTQALNIDQSIAHNGVCLTVVAVNENEYTVTAVQETLGKTTLGQWQAGDPINLEEALRMGDKLDGHIVQGHVDSTGVVIEKKVLEGSYLFTFRFPESFAALVIEKGSICINGVSLTAFNVGRDTLSVTIIPYTYEHTNFNRLREGDKVNLEFDLLGKYLLRKQALEH